MYLYSAIQTSTHEHSKPLIAIPWKGPHTHRCECCSHWNVDYSSNLQSAIVRVGPTTRPGRDCQEGTAGRKAKRGGKNLAPSAWAVCAAGPLQAEPLPGILGRRCQVLLFFFYFWFLVLLQMPFPGGVRVFARQIAETVLARGIYSRSIYSRMRWPTLWLFSGSTHSDKTFW